MTNSQTQADRRQKALLRRLVRYIAVIGVLALAVIGMIVLSNATKLTVPVPLATEVSANDWTKGNPEADVVIVEYSDFQCPFCAPYEPVMTQLLAEYGDRMLFVYRHFPLKTLHRNATSSAAAAEAAGIQGKFWEMHNMLFANQNSWSDLANPSSEFEKYAAALGLNTEQFMTDYASKTVKDEIEADYQSGLDAGLDSTPSFFLNGSLITTNPQGYEGLATLIENELAKINQEPDSVTP